MTSVSRRALLGYSGVGAVGAVGLVAATQGAAAADGVPGGVQELASLQLLRTTAVDASCAAVRTAGFGAAGDGGGALYRRLAAAPEVQTNPWQAPSADGAWWELAEPVVDVRMLGAVGDGVTDDTAALTAAAGLGGTVYVPGTDACYLCRATVQLTSGATWYGDGVRSLIKLAPDAGTGIGQLLGIGFADQNSVTVQGIRVHGLALDTSNLTNANGVGGSYCSEVYLDNLSFTNIGRKAVTFQYNCHDIHVRDITVHQAATEPGSTAAAVTVEGGTGGIASMHDLTFENITVEQTGYNSIAVSDATRVRFDGVSLGDTAGAGSHIVFFNTVTDSHVRGVSGGDTGRRMISFGSSVTGCSVQDFTFGTVTDQNYSRSNAIECLGEQNRFQHGSLSYGNIQGQAAILVMGRKNTLSGITVLDSKATGYVVHGSAGALPDDTSVNGVPDDLHLDDCVIITSTTTVGLYSEGGRARVRDSEFFLPSAARAADFAGSNNIFSGNYVNLPGTVYVRSGGTASVTGNLFYSGSGGTSQVTFQDGAQPRNLSAANVGLS